MRFVRDGWGHRAGDQITATDDLAEKLDRSGCAVRVDEESPVEHAVAMQPERRTAKLTR